MTPETSIYEYAKQGLKLSADKTAIWFYGKGITYRELFRSIDCVADHLYSLGVRQGTAVTIHLPNCPQAAISIYAIAKLGGICNIVHPLTPLDGLRKNMEFAESKFLIVGSQNAQADEIDFADKVVYVDISRMTDFVHMVLLSLKQRPKCPQGAVDFDALLYPNKETANIPKQSSLKNECICYLHSSGTTGVPKTVMHSHLACNNWVHNAKAFFGDSSLEGEVVLSVLPIFHGSGLVMNLHQVLCAGGTQVLMARWDAKAAVDAIRKYKITVLTGVPLIYQRILEQRRFKGQTAKRISQCYVSGDATPLALKEAFNERVGHPVMFEGYGMTETVTACFATSAKNNNINASGYPLVNCTAAVLDVNDELQYHGTGELVLSTNTMMLGYLKDPIATEKSFLRRDGRCWFRTGDYGRIDNDGYLYFLERKKNIIIRNGYNVYPGEIEAVIRNLPFVKDVTVIGRKVDSATGEDICAFVVLSEQKDQQMEKEEIIKLCYERLPRYAVPNVVLAVNEIPRNSMSKVDKNKLVEML